ncbi:MAG: MBL fold metallo-hydrolase RNA specificity domain-containing protein [Nanoarchaeota archaeon]
MEVCTIGGFEEVGKNMTAVKVGEDVIIFDMGIFLPPVIELQEQENQQSYTEKQLREVEALPDDKILDKLGWRNKVKAIAIGHAHLDHVGGVPYISYRYPNAQILATPFTMKVLDKISKDEKIKIKNKKREIKMGQKVKINNNLTLEFLNITHSTLQCAFIAMHTQEGVFFYALDFKLDNHPVIGNPPDYKRFREIGKKGVKALVIDALYSGTDRRTASERIARNLLEDALSYTNKKNALFITTFSSHIARLKSIVDFGKRTGREIIFIGRSLNKYVKCAIEVNQCPFKDRIKLVAYKNQVNSILRKVEKNREKYLVVCTGHQGETGSILDRIVKGGTPFKFKADDNIIFSSKVIPAPINVSQRERLDKKLKKTGVRIQSEVHVSGHGGREDLRDMIEILKPDNIIPAHGSLQQETPLIELATELGYDFGKSVHLSSDGKVLKF